MSAPVTEYYGKNPPEFVQWSPEKEKELFTRYRAGDIEARDEIVQGYLLYAASVAQRASVGTPTPNEDAISAANEGLMRAVEKFDHNRGPRFSSFAFLHIRGSVIQMIKKRAEHARLQRDYIESELQPLQTSDAFAEHPSVQSERVQLCERILSKLTLAERKLAEDLFINGDSLVSIARRSKPPVTCECIRQRKQELLKRMRMIYQRVNREDEAGA